MFEAIADYALDLKEPDFNGVSKTIFNLMKPQFYANYLKWLKGHKGAPYGKFGGRPNKKTPSKPHQNPSKRANEKEKEKVNEKVENAPPPPTNEDYIAAAKKFKLKISEVKDVWEYMLDDVKGKGLTVRDYKATWRKYIRNAIRWGNVKPQLSVAESMEADGIPVS